MTAKQHQRFVKLGLFDRTPIYYWNPIKIGDLVVTKKDNICYQVYGKKSGKVFIGYDDRQKRVRKTLLLKNVRKPQDYVDFLDKLGMFNK